ncbi:MAG: hypothetical protein M3Z25_11440 [Actinomycetota bacterium]|nr:hypothetical protein [Actinomycetota bacterium]
MTTALTSPDRPSQLDASEQRTQRYPLDALVPDPSDLAPLCDEPEFAAILEELVADEAPRLFAVVQEYGERVNVRIAAWGMAFAEHTEIVSAEREVRMSLQAPENALWMFKLGSHIRARLVWLNPDAATPTDDDDEAA